MRVIDPALITDEHVAVVRALAFSDADREWCSIELADGDAPIGAAWGVPVPRRHTHDPRLPTGEQDVVCVRCRGEVSAREDAVEHARR